MISLKKDLKKCLQNPILVDDALLSWLDYFKAGLFRCKCRYKIKLPDKITIHGVDTNFIFKNYFNAGLKSTYIAKHYLIYLAAKKLLRKVQVDHFFNLFENYAWEKVTTLAIRENPKKIKLTAFQHAQVAQSSTKFFLGKKESRCSPLPDKIVTLGEITRDFLVNQKKYPDDVTVTGCALRHNYPDVSGIIPRKHHNRILVFLWTFEYSIRLLNFLCSCNIPQDRYAITVRPHPTLPFDALKPRLGREYNGIFRISNRSLKKDFARTDIVVYSGTTSCLDALASGLPVINIEFGDFVSPDPLFCFSDFKWTVNKPDELESAFESIYKLTDSEYYSRQAKAFDFVRKYFYAVNNQNLQVFFE